MTNADFLWKLIIVVMAVGELVRLVIGIWVSFRRNPPLPEELYRNFLSKGDHDKMCDAVKNRFDALDNHNSDTHKEIFAAIRALSDEQTAAIQHYHEAVMADFKVLERGLGRVEGQLRGNS